MPTDIAAGAGRSGSATAAAARATSPSASRASIPATGRSRTPPAANRTGRRVGFEQLGLPRHRGRRRRGLGDQPRRDGLAHRPRDRRGASRRSTSRPTRDDRGRRGGRVVDGRRRRGDADRPAHEPGRARRSASGPASCRRSRSAPARSGRPARRGRGVADRARAGPRSRGRSTSESAWTTSRFGAGAVWGRQLHRRHRLADRPAHERRHARTPIGAAQALAAGAGSAWVSTAGATSRRALPASACGELARRREAGRADRVRPPAAGGELGADPRAMADAIRSCSERRDFQGGQVHGRLPSCDDSTAQTGDFEPAAARRTRTRTRARAARRGDRPVQLVLRADRDPDPQPGPGRAAGDDQPGEHPPGLTRRLGARSEGYRGEPEVYYPTGTATTSGWSPARTCRGRPRRCSPSASAGARLRARRALDLVEDRAERSRSGGRPEARRGVRRGGASSTRRRRASTPARGRGRALGRDGRGPRRRPRSTAATGC